MCVCVRLEKKQQESRNRIEAERRRRARAEGEKCVYGRNGITRVGIVMSSGAGSSFSSIQIFPAS